MTEKKQHPCSIRYNAYWKDKKFVGWDSEKKEKVEVDMKGIVLNVVETLRAVWDWTNDKEKIYSNEIWDLREQEFEVFKYVDNKKTEIASWTWGEIKEDVKDVWGRLKLNIYSLDKDNNMVCYSLTWGSMIPFLNEYQKEFGNKVFQIQGVKEWENNWFKTYLFETKSRDIKKEEKENQDDAKFRLYSYINKADFKKAEKKKEKDDDMILPFK